MSVLSVMFQHRFAFNLTHTFWKMKSSASHLDQGTCEELGVEHIDGLIVPGIFTLQVDCVQNILDEGSQHHGEQDGVLRRT